MRDTFVEVVWKDGIPLGVLMSRLGEFSSRNGLTLMPPDGNKQGYPPSHGQKAFLVNLTSGTGGILSIETDDVVNFCPFDDARFRGIHWQLYDGIGKVWFWFSIVRDGLIDARAARMVIAFDEGYSSLIREEQVANAITKYHQLKELFGLLNADVLRGWSAGSLLTEEEDPSFSSQRFRFAREGRQIFIGPMEERRRPRPEEEQEGSFKIVVDPPQGRA